MRGNWRLPMRKLLTGLCNVAVLSLVAACGGTEEGMEYGESVQGSHSWGGYHWARTSNPFTVQLGDNVSGPWDSILGTTSQDWTQSRVLDTTIVAGQAGRVRRCRPTSGRVEVCNDTYGNN